MHGTLFSGTNRSLITLGANRSLIVLSARPLANEVIGSNKNSIKKVIEYKFDEDNNKVKITTIACTRKLANARLSKRTVERSSWTKFGNTVHEDVSNHLTMVSTEEILLECP
ncbi:Eukaryotic translation initiation factor 3 subunit G-2 [Spatholobus suberectus]|nr:Eukaryotic translation initiation factor 3 subunit G-2 [Spatholobus suberectus]